MGTRNNKEKVLSLPLIVGLKLKEHLGSTHSPVQILRAGGFVRISESVLSYTLGPHCKY